MDISIGQVVKSVMGRDKGRYFLVVGMLDSNHVSIADGVIRRIENPKKKKIKHLEPKPELSGTIMEKITGGKRVFDQEIRNCLDALGYQQERSSTGQGA